MDQQKPKEDYQKYFLYCLVVLLIIVIIVGGIFLIFYAIRGRSDEGQEEAQEQEEESAKVYISSEETFVASGDGSVNIEFMGTITISCENGELIITDEMDEAIYSVSGFGEETVVGQNQFKYSGSGSAAVTGDNVVVDISGQNVEFTAVGSGTATFTGDGNVKVCSSSGSCTNEEWTETGLIVEYEQ